MNFFTQHRRALLTAAVAVCFGLTAGCGGNATRAAKGAVAGKAFTDERNGQTYQTVKIGGLTWLAANLNYPTEKGSWCYDGDDSKCAKYGRLYDWKTALAVCPSGWRLPDTADWNRLAKAAGGPNEAGKKLRSKSGWFDNGNIGDDTYGFSALPGGARNLDGGFNDALYIGRWWTATQGAECPKDYADCDAFSREIAGVEAYVRYITVDGSNLMYGSTDRNAGYSVRCVVGESKAVNIDTGDISISVFGVDEEDLKKYKSYESFIKNDEYAQRIAFVPNVPVKDFSWLSMGVMDDPDADEVVYEIKEVLYTLKELTPQKPLVVSWVEVGMMSAFGYSYRDRDGKIKYFMGQAANYGGDPEEYDGPAFLIYPFTPPKRAEDEDYKLTTIGGQEWFSQNLRHRNGNSWCPEKDKANCEKYGRLYDWNSAMTACPKGYHLPTDDEWAKLIAAVGGAETAGKKLKSASGWKESGWNYGGNGTDDYDFSALPGGSRLANGTYGGTAGKFGYWWTATESGGDRAYFRSMLYTSDEAGGGKTNDKGNGFAVRCLRD